MRLVLALLGCFFIGDLLADDALPELKINQVAQDLYEYESHNRVNGFGLVSSNGLVVLNAKNKQAFLVDTPWSEADTQTLVAWVEQQGYAVVGSISTHSHKDRTAGIAWLNEHGIATYATRHTNEILAEVGEPLASHALEGDEFPLFDGALQGFFPGSGHTRDNIVVWLPGQKLLYGGCFVKSLDSEDLGYTGESVIAEWPASVDRVLARFPDAKLVVPGHGGKGDVALLQHTRQLAVEHAAQSAAVN
jgi:glyoxylase-like metal-dependent hydrolase (beta-lactamase superfamily II)